MGKYRADFVAQLEDVPMFEKNMTDWDVVWVMGQNSDWSISVGLAGGVVSF